MSDPVRFFGPAFLTTSPTLLFTGQSDKESLVQLIHVTNALASAVTMTLSINSDSAGTRIYDSYTFAANEMRSIPAYYVLDAGETMEGYSGSASGIVLTISGNVTDFSANLGDYGHGIYGFGASGNYGGGN